MMRMEVYRDDVPMLFLFIL
uniref:Uncharacterized protein n=1 Tax=Rhizophora mucronata TaxID=61149 RepID=A0A2P2PPU0_RHIMU